MSKPNTVAKLKVGSMKDPPSDALDKKVQTELKFARLVTPKTTKRNTKISPSTIIDLTLTEPKPFFVIKNEHPLFFSYDPRGNKKIKKAGIDYCEHCLCPSQYCAEVVFGSMTSKRTMSLIKHEGIDYYDDEDDIATEYAKIYTNFVVNKMSWNNISFRFFDEDIPLGIPRCMQMGSLTQLCTRVQKKRDKEADAVWSADLDLTEKELDDFVAKNCKKIHDTPPREPDEDIVIKENVDESSIVKRTAVEQASDVGPMFKRMKQKIREYTTGEV